MRDIFFFSLGVEPPGPGWGYTPVQTRWSLFLLLHIVVVPCGVMDDVWPARWRGRPPGYGYPNPVLRRHDDGPVLSDHLGNAWPLGQTLSYQTSGNHNLLRPATIVSAWVQHSTRYHGIYYEVGTRRCTVRPLEVLCILKAGLEQGYKSDCGNQQYYYFVEVLSLYPSLQTPREILHNYKVR